MKMMSKIPTGLNAKESAMTKSLLRSQEPNIEKRWHYNNVQDIIARKKTDPLNGDSKITFDYVPRKIVVEEKEKSEKEDEKFSLTATVFGLEKLKETLDEKIKEIEVELQELKGEGGQVGYALSVLRGIKGGVFPTEK